MDGVRVAAVFAADTDLQGRVHRAALLDGDPDQSAHAVPVEGLEGRGGENALGGVGGEERRLDVVAGQSPRRLRQVVCAEGEELGGLGDPAGGQRGTGQFDHRADGAVDREWSAGTVGAGRGCHFQACTRRSAVARRRASLAAQCAAARPSGEPSIPAATCRGMVRTSCVHAGGFLFSHRA
jgi:hypothetical protein